MPVAQLIEVKMSFGDNLKRLRRDKGWTQGQLADAADLKLTHIPRLEKDGADPKLSTLYRLANALDCSFDTLLMDTDKVGMSGYVQASMERLSQLDETEQFIIVDIIDAMTTRKALESSFEEKKGFKLHLWKDKPERLYKDSDKPPAQKQ